MAVTRWGTPGVEFAHWLAAQRLSAGEPLSDPTATVVTPFTYRYPPPLAQVLAPLTLGRAPTDTARGSVLMPPHSYYCGRRLGGENLASEVSRWLRRNTLHHLHAADTHAQGGAGLVPGTAAWDEWVKDYYRDVESYDWVDVADNLRGPEALFHRNRARAVRKLVARNVSVGERILDAGCGTGLNLRHLPPGSVGLDINPRNVAIAAARLPDHRVLLGDIEAMPFGDAQFDAIVCTEVLEHVPSAARALDEIRRVLKPGGVLIGSVPARSLIWRLRFLSSTCPHDEPFHNEYVPAEVRQMLAGFGIEKLGYSLMRFSVVFVARR